MISLLRKNSIHLLNLSLKNVRRCQYPVSIATDKIQQSYRTYADAATTLSDNTAGQNYSWLFDKAFDDVHAKNYLTAKSMLELYSCINTNYTLTPSQSLFLLRCCGCVTANMLKEKRQQLAEKIWKSYSDAGVILDISHYNVYLNVSLENDHDFNPSEFLKMLQENDLQPNRVTMRHLIHKYCEDGNIEGANQLLEYMKEHNLPISKNIFNSFILGNSRANDMDGARQVIDIMKESDAQPTGDSYLTLAQAYAEHGDLDSFTKVINDCKASEIFFNEGFVLSLIGSLVDKGLDEAASQLFACLESDMHISLLHKMCQNWIYSGKYKEAYQWLAKTHREGSNYFGSFFPRTMVSAGLPMKDVAEICRAMTENRVHILSYECALQEYMQDGTAKQAIDFLKIMIDNNCRMRANYFYPILCKANKSTTVEIIEEINASGVLLAANDYQLYVANSCKSEEELSSLYREVTNTSSHLRANTLSAFNGFLARLIDQFDMAGAVQFCQKFRRTPYYTRSNKLCLCYLKTNDAAGAVYILGQMLPMTSRLASDHADYVPPFFFKKFLFQIAEAPGDKLEPFLQEMVKQNLPIPRSFMDDIIAGLGEKASPTVTALLEQLTQLEYQTNAVNVPPIYDSRDIVDVLDAIHRDNIREAEVSIQKLHDEGKTLPDKIKLMMVGAYYKEKNLEKIERIFDSLTELDKTTIRPSKVLQYAHLLVQEGRFADASQAVLTHTPESGIQRDDLRSNPKFISLTHLFEPLLESDDFKALELLQNNLIERNFGNPEFLCSFAIHYHLKRNDFDKAVEVFLGNFEKYRIVPGKQELMVECIKREDSVTMQKVNQADAAVHGEMNAMYSLASSLVAAKQYTRAEKVMRTPGLKPIPVQLEYFCGCFLKRKDSEGALKFIELAKVIHAVNRKPLFTMLLDYYCLQGETEKALDLWTVIQEDGEEPEDNFLKNLGHYLKKNGEPVPFALPNSTTQHTQQREQREQMEQSVKTPHKFAHLLSYIIENKIDRAVDEARNISNKKLSNRNINRYLISQLGTEAGLTADALLSYSSRLNSEEAAFLPGAAYTKLEKYEEFAQQIIEGKIDKFMPFHLSMVLENKPELEPLVVKVAEVLQEKGMYEGWWSILDYKAATGDRAAAQELYDKYFSDSSAELSLVYSCTVARIKKDPEVLNIALDILKTNPEKNAANLAKIYAVSATVLFDGGKIKACLDKLEESLKFVSATDYSPEFLTKFENKANAHNIPVPSFLSERIKQNNSSSSSSTSSDRDSD